MSEALRQETTQQPIQETAPRTFIILETEPGKFEAVEPKNFTSRMDELKTAGGNPQQVTQELNEEMAAEFIRNRMPAQQ